MAASSMRAPAGVSVPPVTASATEGPVAAPAPARAAGGYDSVATAAAEDAADSGTLLVAREQQILQIEMERLQTLRQGLASRGKAAEVRAPGVLAGPAGPASAPAAPPTLGGAAAGRNGDHRLPSGHASSGGLAFGAVVEGGDVVPTPSHGSRRLPAEPDASAPAAGGAGSRFARTTSSLAAPGGTYVAEASVTITPGGTARVVGGRTSQHGDELGAGGRRGSADSAASELSHGPLHEEGAGGYGAGLGEGSQ
jgi:hypothetical protein